MIDPLVSLAFSIYGNPGVYALLLGSGLSRSAGIPTGWEVVQDLIKKLALLEGQEPVPDAEQWYRSTHNAEPDYSDLLNQLARTPVERAQLLRSYFEPTDEERQQGLKTPTAAHRAIAELVKAGYIRIVVTTNFDRLLETALVDAGVQPAVISSADSIKGALPLSHAECLILKINGDYLDARIKNTQVELSVYDPALNTLLDRVFDEFGLIVCGWSGDWDLALRAAIERCPSRRFSMYWASRGTPTTTASDLITARGGAEIQIASADAFFVALKEKTLALAQFGQNHPLSAKLAAFQTKRYIVRSEDRILLHDLVMAETERAYSAMDPKRFHAGHVSDASAELVTRLHAYEAIIEVPLAIISVGGQWGQKEHEYLWQCMLKRFGDPPGESGGLIAWLGLRRYPAALLMYAGGVAALIGRQYENLAAILRTPLKRAHEKEAETAAEQLNTAPVMQNGLAKLIPGKKNHHTPFSDHVFEILREHLRATAAADADYEDAFLLFEYVLGLLVWSERGEWAPVGRARWSRSEMFSMTGPTGPDQPEIGALAAALFPGGISDYTPIKSEYDAWALKATPSWGF